MQLAPGWRTGANCDRYPRGDRRLGEASTDKKHYNRAGKLSVRIPTQEAHRGQGKVREGDTCLLFNEIQPSQKWNSDGTRERSLTLYGRAASGPPHSPSGLTFGEAPWLTTELLRKLVFVDLPMKQSHLSIALTAEL